MYVTLNVGSDTNTFISLVYHKLIVNFLYFNKVVSHFTLIPTQLLFKGCI